ncbi:RecT family recombinase [Gayadomonas joobiniege]|uniref:RecT family recombinase n=1 Tax=Gayadomonas joobiniege TaxID=1234606 RepID=UPI00035CF0BE|nr:RecT family recombinase [Gayadomonas joobiniege]
MELANQNTQDITVVNQAEMQSLLFNPNMMQALDNVARLMASGKSTVPDHLKNNPADCFALVMQAAQWKMNPFAVAQKTATIGGKLVYEGQLVNAVIASNAPVKERLRFEHFGDWNKVLNKHVLKKGQSGKEYAAIGWDPRDEQGLGVTVSAHIIGEDEPRVEHVYLAQCHPRFSTYWATNPKVQITYTAARIWARMHCPDVLLGVYTPDEMEETARPYERDVTPQSTGNSAKDLTGFLAGQGKVNNQSEAEAGTNNHEFSAPESTESEQPEDDDFGLDDDTAMQILQEAEKLVLSAKTRGELNQVFKKYLSALNGYPAYQKTLQSLCKDHNNTLEAA